MKNVTKKVANEISLTVPNEDKIVKNFKTKHAESFSKFKQSKLVKTDLNKILAKYDETPKPLKEKSFEGANKIKTRGFINAALTIRKGLIGCLPSKKAEMEQIILETTPRGINFIAYEWEDDIYFELVKLIADKRLPISPNRGAINNWLMKLTENELSNLILDYCGCINTFKKELEYCFDNKVIGINGIIAMTFCINDVHYKKGIIGEMFESIDNTMFKSDLTKIELGIMNFFNGVLNKECNFKHYKLEKWFKYSDANADTNKGMDMVLIIVRRVK